VETESEGLRMNRTIFVVLREDVTGSEVEPYAFDSIEGAQKYVLSMVCDYYLDPIKWDATATQVSNGETDKLQAEIHLDTWTIRRVNLLH
jgi:hypothetical protein